MNNEIPVIILTFFAEEKLPKHVDRVKGEIHSITADSLYEIILLFTGNYGS